MTSSQTAAPVAIVTDSTADLPAALADENQIHVIPQILIVEGKSMQDGGDLSREEFYTRLPQMRSLPSTAVAAVGAFETLYEKLFHAGARQVCSIHLASELSGTVNAANTAAQAFPGKVEVIDSRSLTLGLGFQVLAAARAARSGAEAGQIKQIILETARRVRVVAMLDTLEYIRRSGRVSWIRAQLGQLLRVKLFLEIRTGRVLNLGQVRTRQMGLRRLQELLAAAGPLQELAILHTNAEADAADLRSKLDAGLLGKLNHPPLVINVTTIIGTHIGPNGLGFACVTA